jgi:tetratricopeptide (TPR) repeat protein
MTMIALRSTVALVLFILTLATIEAGASGEDPAIAHEAAKHFERGVALYSETDYASALVEFKRAHALLPNPTVLYNIGETQYQLQDYAGALTTFTRYLAEVPPPGNRRLEVENDVEVLRSRVGHLWLVTSPPGADITIDDQPVGKTPLFERLLVSVGHRKVAAAYPGRATATRFVDVAADDNVSVTLDLPASNPAATLSGAASDSIKPSGGPASLRSSLVSRPTGWIITGWTATGLLATGAAVAGGFALRESASLASARDTFPTSSGTLQDDSNLTRTYSILADSLTAGAIVIGAITLFETLTTHGLARKSDSRAHLHFSPKSMDLRWRF